MPTMFTDKELKEFVEKTLELWHVPGLALAVVRDDQPILCEGFGFRNISQDYDIFEVFFETADQRQKIAFITDLRGKVARIAAQLEPKVSEIIFNRLPD
jgi:hypothetical protein